jgi:uncharacterized protein
MEQGWYRLLFAHWPVPWKQIRDLVPPELEIDTFAGEAWVSIVPFEVRLRPRWLLSLGKLWSFPELNCRTYVRYRGHAGIYFFSLDAGSLPAVLGARAFFRLPYFHSHMQFLREHSATRFKSERQSANISFTAEYRPASSIYNAVPGTLEHWLTERYCLFTMLNRDVFRTDIHHCPWLLQKVETEIFVNTVGTAAGLSIEGPPVFVGYAEQQEVLVWPLCRA